MVLAPQYGSNGSGLTVEQAALLEDALTYDPVLYDSGTEYAPNTLVRKVAGGTVYLQADTVPSTGDDPELGAPWEVWDGATGDPQSFASAHPFIAGRFLPLFGPGTVPTFTTVALADGRCDLHLYVADVDDPFDQLGLWVTTGVAGDAKILAYSLDADGWPDVLVYDSGNLDVTNTNTYPNDATGLPSIAAGTPLWIGVIGNNTATVRGVQSIGARSLSMAASSDGAVGYAIRRSGLTFASPPNPWVFVATDITTSNTAVVIGRIA